MDGDEIVRALNNIADKLHKPFKEHDQYTRHNQILERQEKLVKWTKYLAIFTAILCVGTLLTVIIGVNQVITQQEALDPQITVQLSAGKTPWGHYAEEYYETVDSNYLNRSYYIVPIYIEINNNGQVPFQLYNIQFSTSCKANRGLLSLPDEQPRIIPTGEVMVIEDEVSLSFNETVAEGIPCIIFFNIYGKDIQMQRRIVLSR